MKLVKEELTTITPEMAKELLKTNQYSSHQRDFREWHCRDIEKSLKAGEVKPTQNIILAKENHNSGRVLLEDGQHRLNAIVRSGVPMRALLQVFETDDAYETDSLYISIDDGLQRSIGDLARPILLDMNCGHLLAIRGKVTNAVAEFTGNKSSPRSKKVALLPHHKKEIEFVGHFFLDDKGKAQKIPFLYRTPVMVCMLVGYHIDPDRADEFFTGVAFGADLPRNHPSLGYRDYLLRVQGDKETTEREVRAMGSHYWNAFIEGRTYKKAPQYNKKDPVPSMKRPKNGG